MNNEWVVADESFASWECRLPAIPETNRLDWSLTFLENILKIGSETRIWNIIQTKSVLRYNGYPTREKQSYIDYIKEMAYATGRIHFLPFIDITTLNIPGKNVTPGLISYFNLDGVIVENEINDVGSLVKELHPQNLLAHRYSLPLPPVSVLGVTVPLIGSYPAYENSFVINLDTDIWFPKVLGYLREDNGDNKTCKYDNMSLASLHTPRLNHFLKSIKELSLSMGCRWEVSAISPYAEMVLETGIVLE